MSTENTIVVEGLSKNFMQYKKNPGLTGSFKSLFRREEFDIEAVKDVSFTVKKGEFVGFIGPNGAGKTTTLKCLSGLMSPTQGNVEVLGYTPWQRKKEYLKKISFVMGQKNQLWWDLPATDSFELTKEIYQISDKNYNERLGQLVEMLDLKEVMNIQVRKLSLGQRMRCELAAALLHDPEVLFLDEPTIGLDVVVQQKLRDFFKQYNHLHKTTIILTSHYMEDVKKLADRVVVINSGELIYDGNLDNLIKTYIKEKSISIVSRKRLSKSQLDRFGVVSDFGRYNAVINVPRQDVPAISSKILKELPVEDLDIKEVSLDEVVRRVFNGEKSLTKST